MVYVPVIEKTINKGNYEICIYKPIKVTVNGLWLTLPHNFQCEKEILDTTDVLCGLYLSLSELNADDEDDDGYYEEWDVDNDAGDVFHGLYSKTVENSLIELLCELYEKQSTDCNTNLI